MREIKLRIWHKAKNDWMYLDLNNIKLERFCSGSNGISNGEDYYFDEQGFNTLEKYLYTGLKDKNNKEIYEGDIDKEEYIVTWGGDSSAGLGMNAGWYLQRGDFESWIELESRRNDNHDNHEIIGNIYENRELLDG